MQSRILKETALILFCAILAGLITNVARKDGIALYRSSVQAESVSKRNDFAISIIPLRDVILAWKEEGTLIIDARDPGFYKLGHIPGALNLPLSQFDSIFPSLKKRMQTAQKLIIYCSGTGCHTSKKVAEKCLNWIQRIDVFEGGIESWKKAGMPLEKS